MGQEKILVIDDDQGLIDIIQANLEPEGFQVVGATNGIDGLRLLKAEQPSLVILDVLMPGVDGWGVLRQMQADPRTAAIPVIMLTAVCGTEDAIRGLEGGAIEYTTKPFYPADLVASVKIMLRVFDPTLRQQYRSQRIAKRRRSLTDRRQ